jgi:negative regulator of flagellin synthesis FlgM
VSPFASRYEHISSAKVGNGSAVNIGKSLGQENDVSTKIGGFDSSPVPAGTGHTVKRAGDSGSSAPPAEGGSTADTHITDSARKLAALEQVVRDLPAVDEARVEQVSARLANGSYQIDAGRIADQLLRAEQDLADRE